MSASGRRRKAVALLRSTASSHPDSPEVWCRLAAALLDRGDATAALTAVRRAMPLGGDKAWTHRLASKALSRLSRHEEAVSAARQAVRAAPSDWRCRIALAEAFGAAGSWPDAVDAAAQAVRYQPDHVRPYLVLGDAAQRTGDLATAERAYRTAMRRKPGDPRVRAELARLRRPSSRDHAAEQTRLGQLPAHERGAEHTRLSRFHQPTSGDRSTELARSWATSSDRSAQPDRWPRPFGHDLAADRSAAGHDLAADRPAIGRAAVDRSAAGQAAAVDDLALQHLSSDQPAHGRTSAFRRSRAFRRTSAAGRASRRSRTPDDDRTPDDGRTPSDRRAVRDGRSAVDSASGHGSRGADRSSGTDRPWGTDPSPGTGRSLGAGRSPVPEKLAWRGVRQLSMTLVVGGMFLMVAGLPKPTPVLAWLGFAIPCVVILVAVVELFRVPSGCRFAVLTMPLRRPVIGLSCVLLALSNALVLLWAMLDRANAGTMEPLIFALVCAVCAGAVALVNEA
ncbi:tetratricopeptide repeat protein [Kutzneria kofuensis]|uniref:Flp pilus assembly protein TadD n=1 Tax=Kutzneria kofuensis TaxID=103725 RepID=A0A7W9KE78_9PSEU|nr:tetratricopeptide repeat protein [Kutzneria kofuensis]MBB5890921.1 Flp pilus assembly protein TadD [Kutzneria kofuensis]